MTPSGYALGMEDFTHRHHRALLAEQTHLPRLLHILLLQRLRRARRPNRPDLPRSNLLLQEVRKDMQATPKPRPSSRTRRPTNNNKLEQMRLEGFRPCRAGPSSTLRMVNQVPRRRLHEATRRQELLVSRLAGRHMNT
jgi:hypothetical protein